MMKIVRLVTCLLGSRRHGNNSNLFYTKAMPRRRDTTPFEGSKTELFRRIYPAGNPKISMVPILDQWIEQGKFVDKPTLIDIMHKLLRFNRFGHALEISVWMDHKGHFQLTPSDFAFRLHLISKSKGTDEAERYFNDLPQQLKCFPVYVALLNCYATAQCVEKAEVVMQLIRGLGVANHTWSYNNMLNLYRKTRNMEKFNALLQEMEEKGIDKTEDALNIQLSTYADVKDVEGMDKIVSILESVPNVVPDWDTYSAAAAGYTKAGLFDRAVQMLKKAEARLPGEEYGGYNFLLTQYGKSGRKDEVLRVWSLYKNKGKVYNKGYRCVLETLVKLGDIEMAEEIFNEWEYRGLAYDIRIPHILITAYFRRGLIGKAEALLNRAISKGGKPYAWTWYFMYEGYVLNEQYEKAVEMMKKVTADSGIRRKPVATIESIKACLSYLKGVGDNQQAEEFEKLLVDSGVSNLDQREELCVEEDDK